MREAEVDPLDAEQTWPTDEEILEAESNCFIQITLLITIALLYDYMGRGSLKCVCKNESYIL